MLSEGTSYMGSWVAADGTRCSQLMEADHPDSLDEWTARWADVVDFEIVPVLTSDEFWSRPTS
jgi:hypothetical protein